jgi:acyl-CoA thioester hydrolase
MASERVVEVHLRWGDADSFGHINNVVFFRLLEEARARVLSEAGPETEFLTTGVVVVEQRLTYRAPLHYRVEPVAVGMTVSEVGNSSFRLESRIFDPVDGTVFADGYVALVAYSAQSGAPRRLSDAERHWLGA